MTSIRFSVLLVLVAAGLLLSQPASASSQGWLNNSVTFTITPQWSLKLTQELRALDITYADPYMHNLQAGIVYNLPKNFYLAALYKREHVDLGGDIVFDEDRITLEGGWKTGLAKKPELRHQIQNGISILQFGGQQPYPLPSAPQAEI